MRQGGTILWPAAAALACALGWCLLLPGDSLADVAPAAESLQTVEADQPPKSPGLADDLASGKVGKMIRRFSYGAIIVILLLCGLGLPLPEEVPILTSGVLAGMGHMHAWPALAALMIGVMLGDSAMFLLGKRWGSHLFEHRFARRMLTEERQTRIKAAFAKYGALVIFVARFLPGLRAPLFLTAGSMKVKFFTFFSMDGLAALLSVPVSFWVAYYFTDRLQEMLELSHRVLYWVLAGVIVLLLVGHFVWDHLRKKKLAAAPVAATADAPPAPPSTNDSEQSV